MEYFSGRVYRWNTGPVFYQSVVSSHLRIVASEASQTQHTTDALSELASAAARAHRAHLPRALPSAPLARDGLFESCVESYRHPWDPLYR